MRRSDLGLLVRACLALGACGIAFACSGASTNVSSSPPAETAEGGALPCDVDAVLAKSCRGCHGSPTAFGAPMPLLTHGDLHADGKVTPSKKVFELVGRRVHDDGNPMPPPPNARLSASDSSVLDAWIAAGAPAGTSACASDGGAPPPPAVAPLSCTPDQRIRPTSKFAVTSAPDLYVCYGFDTSSAEKRHVIAAAPKIDNTRVVHHVLLYQAEETVDGTPHVCGAGGGSNWRLVTGWAPGGKNFELPPEAGFAEEAGVTHWALQIHYNNAANIPDQLDESGYDLCTTNELRPNDADILATGTLQIEIPPKSTHEVTCDLEFPASFGTINVISSWAHMHRLGRAQSAKRLRSGGETTILDAPSYDFNVGAAAQNVRVDLAPGDTIRTMCRWQNASDATVGFGEGTADEMCFAFLTYYPKITIPRFHWAAPSLPVVSKCTPKTY